MSTLLRALATIAAAGAAVAALVGCGAAPAAPAATSPAVVRAHAVEHFGQLVASMPNLSTHPLATNREAFATKLAQHHMSVRWTADSAVVTDKARDCVSTLTLSNSDLTSVRCSGTTFTGSALDELMMTFLSPAQTHGAKTAGGSSAQAPTAAPGR